MLPHQHPFASQPHPTPACRASLSMPPAPPHAQPRPRSICNTPPTACAGNLCMVVMIMFFCEACICAGVCAQSQTQKQKHIIIPSSLMASNSALVHPLAAASAREAAMTSMPRPSGPPRTRSPSSPCKLCVCWDRCVHRPVQVLFLCLFGQVKAAHSSMETP